MAETFIHPHGLFRNVLVTGPLAVVGTIALWWLGSLPDEAHPEVGRVVFGNQKHRAVVASG